MRHASATAEHLQDHAVAPAESLGLTNTDEHAHGGDNLTGGELARKANDTHHPAAVSGLLVNNTNEQDRADGRQAQQADQQ
jgi:hypothetical protein